MDASPLWVFAYGSLIWDPGFPVAEAVPARAAGWRRHFCMWSIHHRGTPEAPGLVLALDAAEGAACAGMALRVAAGAEAETLAALRARELVSSAYLETALPLSLPEGGAVRALAYVVDRSHPQYCGTLPGEDQARVIARAAGGRGPNRDYLAATVAALARHGIDDPDLIALHARVQALRDAPGD